MQRWAVDCEWGFRDGRVDEPSAFQHVVFCAVNLDTGERLTFWGKDPRLSTWIADHFDDLFVAHNAVSEMKYLLQMGIRPPPRWHDTMVAERYITNRWKYSQRGYKVNLSESLHRLKLAHLAPAGKKALQKKILHLDFTDADRPEIEAYCLSDCDGAAALYLARQDRVPLDLMAHWGEYLLAVALMELRGIPFDFAMWDRVLANRKALIQLQVEKVNRIYPVYDGIKLKRGKFFEWADREGIRWPLKKSKASGKLLRSLDKDTLKEMETRHWFIAEFRQVKKTVEALNNRSLVLDRVTGRHYHSHMPFVAVTGRSQPRGFIWGGPKWQRFHIVPESPDHRIALADYRVQEFAISAALSGDKTMQQVARSDDAHMDFAIRCGAAPPGSTKKTSEAIAKIRKAYKTVNLGVLYGQTEYGISSRLGISLSKAAAMIADHKRLFPAFWDWRERVVDVAFSKGRIVTRCGWPALVGPTTNERTWANFEAQSTGSDVMRATVVYLTRQNVKLLAVMHDGFLLTCLRDQLDNLRQAVDFACSQAVRHSLGDFPIAVDFTVYEDRLRDEDGEKKWEEIQRNLALLEARNRQGELVYA
jgi:DNA polymerase I-like protein with 3'-5' exonuclease and polymerase domains